MKFFPRNLLNLGVYLTVALASAQCRANQTFSLDKSQLTDTKTTVTDKGLRVDFGANQDWPNITWRAPDVAGWDWSVHDALVFTLTNPTTDDVAFHVKINDHDATGKRHAAQLSGVALAARTQRFYVSLQARSLRERSGMRNLPPILGDYGSSLGSGVEPTHIDQLQIFRAQPTKPATLIIESIILCGQASTPDLNGIIDRYGQYTRADWPHKIHFDADLQQQKRVEDADLQAHHSIAGRSRWGGWSDGPRLQATGFFRTAQREGKWWLVDPKGYLFLSVGIDVIRPDLSTRIAGREAMFRWLPATDDDLAQFGSGGTEGNVPRDYNFLGANWKRKYGAYNDTAFANRAVARLNSWGFNTIGNWTPENLGQQQQFPYVVALETRGQFATVPGHKGGKMPDPFDPDFAIAVENSVKTKAALAKNDAACVGYFYDNELPWGMPNVDNEHYVLCFGTLAQEATSPAKQAFLQQLQARYGTIDALNANWNTKLKSWDELAAPFQIATIVKSEAQRADFNRFLRLYADKYFAIVSETIKRHDPNHLYLGCRFAFWFTPEAVEAAASKVDAISFNIYNWNRDTYQFAQKLGKPCFVGEFHFGALDRGMFSGNITVKDQQDRAAHYIAYVKNVLSEPAFVGCHWFQYYDQPTSGRGQDGENFNIGFLSITDTPYSELIAGARQANAQVYRWHSNARRIP